MCFGMGANRVGIGINQGASNRKEKKQRNRNKVEYKGMMRLCLRVCVLAKIKQEQYILAHYLNKYRPSECLRCLTPAVVS